MQEIITKVDQMNEAVKNMQNSESKTQHHINNLEEKMKKIERAVSGPDNVINSPLEEDQMDGFLRKGIMDNFEEKGMGSTGDDGGVLIKPSMHMKILSFMNARSLMRNLASIDTISSNAIDYVIEEGAMACGWVGEDEARDVTDNSKLKSKRINVHEIFAQPKVTQRLIDDAEISVESWISERLADIFARAENAAFVSGDGDKKPKGFLKNDQIKSLEAGASISADFLLAMLNDLPEQYHAGARFVMNRKTLSSIQSLKDKTDRFIWQNSLSDPLQQSIFGVPVVCMEEMPNAEEDELAIALGDFKSAYKIIDRKDISMMRDPYTEKPFVKYYAVKRVGGDVLNPDALRLGKITG